MKNKKLMAIAMVMIMALSGIAVLFTSGSDADDGDSPILLGETRDSATLIPVTLSVDESQGYIEQVLSVVKVESSGSTTFFLTQNGMLFGVGANSNYQQGDGTTTAVMTPKQIGSDLGVITDVVCSKDTTLFLTQDGKLYGMGSNSQYQLGGTSSYKAYPTQIGSDLGVITQVTCSDSVTFFVNDEGYLYGLGKNDYGQQGNGTTGDRVSTPTQIGSDLGVISYVTTNGYSTFFLTQDGKLYGMGANSAGQQGDGTTTNVLTPKQIGSDLGVITDVVCVWEKQYIPSTTFFLTQDGKLYGMGTNSAGQQGDGTTTNVLTPKQIGSDLGIITSVNCSGNTTFFITQDGKLYGMGLNNYGQQGDGTTTNVKTPKQIGSDLGVITKVDCPDNTTFFLTQDGKLYGMGQNNYGQQGDGTTTNVLTPTQVGSDLGIITDFVSKNLSTYFITSEGKLYGMGRNYNGQQGDGTTTDVLEPKQILPPIVSGSTIIIQVPEGTEVTTSGDTITFGNDSYRFVSTGSESFSGWDAPETITEEITINVEFRDPPSTNDRLLDLIPFLVLIVIVMFAAGALLAFRGDGIDLIKLLIGLSVVVIVFAAILLPVI